MSTPAPGGSSLRTAGVALVGLALVLAAIGALTGSSGDTPAAATATSPAGPSATTLPTTTTTPPPTTTTATPATTTAPATTATPTTAPPTTVPPTTVPPTTVPPVTTVPPTTAVDPRAGVDVVVLNNSTVGGLASRAAEDVRRRGWTVVEVGNFTGLVPTTTVYYRPGTAEEPAARALAQDTGARVEPRFAGLPSAAPGVVLVVTSDYAS